MTHVASGIGRDLRDRVLERLGFASPPPADSGGLAALYAAWCTRVPFDNVRKLVALRTSPTGPLPGGDATDFFEHWLAHGTGGTCWPTSNALWALLAATGFRARRVAASMRDLGTVNHGSVKVRLDGADWLVDSSMLTGSPLPLGDGVFASGDPMVEAEVEASEGTHVVWTRTPPSASHMPCRVLRDPSDDEEYLGAYERSRERSPFNDRLYARRDRPGELRLVLGATLHSKSARGAWSRDLSPDEVVAALREKIGISEEMVDAWRRSGGLARTLTPAPGEKPPPETRLPPSLRAAAERSKIGS